MESDKQNIYLPQNCSQLGINIKSESDINEDKTENIQSSNDKKLN